MVGSRFILGLDATPLLGQPTGVGRYVQGLISGLSQLEDPPQPVLALFSLRGSASLPQPHPPATRWAPIRLPARLLHRAWSRSTFPPVELVTGRVHVFHGTNFVLPPRATAGGVVTVHDLAFLRFPETVQRQTLAYRALVPAAVKCSDAVVTVSSSVAEELQAEYGVPADKIVVAPNGVDRRWFQASQPGPEELARLGLPQNYLLFIGNLEPRKNLGVLLRAYALARREDPRLGSLVLAGPAGWGDRWAGSEGPGQGVVLAGYLPQRDLESVVAGCQALCMPSLYEGFGLPIIEAFAVGRPVMASDIPAHRETAGQWARLVPPRDVDAWAQALLDSGQLDGPQQTEKRREWARNFTWANSARRHLEAYRMATTGAP